MPKREPPKRHLPNGIAWAAQQLGVGYSTMYRMVTRGEVTTVEVSGRRRIPDSEIDRLQPLMGGGGQRRLQRLTEQAREVDRKRLEAEERVLVRRQQLIKELRELESS
jgi:excisionase family DNA binding protein